MTCCDLLQSLLHDRDSRISELEEALRESIRITAQREVVMAEMQMKLEHTERMVRNCYHKLSLLCVSMGETDYAELYGSQYGNVLLSVQLIK